MNKIISPILAVLTLGAAAGAMAQTAAPESSLSFNAGAVSDYRYRGISQSRKSVAVQGGADYADKSGFYVGAWGSTISWIHDAGLIASPQNTNVSGPVELDLYGGYKGTAGAVAYDVGYLRYQYQGNTLEKVAKNANTDEVYGAATVGVVTAKYSYAFSNLFGNANSKGSYYLDLSAALDLGNGYSLTPHVGYQSVAGVASTAVSLTYTDYALTLGKDLGNGLSASAAVIGTNAKTGAYYFGNNQMGAAGAVVGLKYAF